MQSSLISGRPCGGDSVYSLCVVRSPLFVGGDDGDNNDNDDDDDDADGDADEDDDEDTDEDDDGDDRDVGGCCGCDGVISSSLSLP